MNPVIDITSQQRKTLVDLLRQYIPGVEVWAYGSRVQWTARHNSDLDLVAFIPLSKKSRIDELREALAESDLPFLVDLHIWNEIPERFHEIIRGNYAVIQEEKDGPISLFDIQIDGWDYTTLGEICARGQGGVQTGPFGSQLHASDYVADGIPSIMPQNIGDNRIIRDGIARITLEDAERLERYRVRTGDIVYSRRGDVEKRALVRKEEDGWLCGTGCLRVRFGIDDVDSAYASFYLGDPRVRAWIVRHAQGATMPNLNTAILSALPFVVPPVEEQRAIAQILSALDDRIEMLRNMNETLEAIAQATFKSWFVDFDPVRAKAEGREPEGMNAAVAALFSSRFQDSELGSIPQGWTTGPITNVLSLNPVRSLKKEVPATYLDMASVPTSGYRASSWIKRDFGSGSKFINGDTLLARITPCLENGKTAYVDFLKQGEVGWGSTEFIVMATKPNVPSQFAYLLARDLEFRQYAIQSMSGTSGRQRVQVDQLANFKFSYATEAVYRAFGEIVEPLFTAMSHNDNHAKSLMDLRDTLLPRLISGKMRMPKPEQLLEAVL